MKSLVIMKNNENVGLCVDMLSRLDAETISEKCVVFVGIA